ncbi:hypothetical protein ACE4RV_01040 [Acetobacter persici]|uniref:hypothetical protein n=1 Tax=Acetobacter persici TaxID=1076596 RepID=UPI0036D888B7
MYRWFDLSVASDINNKTWNHSLPYKGYGELKQLSKLFDGSYLSDLHRSMMRKILFSGASMANLSIELGYIDKMPYAEPSGSPKREVGDAIIFGIEEIFSPIGNITSNARAVILQAKVTSDDAQLLHPTVPITKNVPVNSTYKELELLHTWPEFMLYERSASKTPYIRKKFDLVRGKVRPYPYGWYLAAPRLKRTPDLAIQSTWPSWWMLGGAIPGEDCNIQFGNFLKDFLQGNNFPTSLGRVEVGASYNPSITSGTSNDWDVLCQEIYKLVYKNPPPTTLFGSVINSIAKIPKIPLYLSRLPPNRNPYPWMLHGISHGRFEGSMNNIYTIYEAEVENNESALVMQIEDYICKRKNRHISQKRGRIPVVIFRSQQFMNDDAEFARPRLQR